MAITSLILLAGCAGSSTKRPPTAAQTSSVTTGFPSFSTWRVAYIGQDSHLHVVSLDGKADIVGIALPPSDGPEVGVWSTGTSPDGKRLAYDAGDGIQYLDVAAGRRTWIRTHGDQGDGIFYWSPSQQLIAIDGGLEIAYLTLSTGAVTYVPVPTATGRDSRTIGMNYGWLDNTHLAVDYLPGQTPQATPSAIGTPATAANLDSLDITTGALRPIVTIRSATLVAGQFSLTPDAREALFFNADYRDFPFTPNVQRIDLATGRATPLPHLTSILPALGGFTQVLWIPATHLALVATGFPQNSDLRYRIIDLDHDTVTAPLAISAFPVAWSPDGRTLVTATGPDAANANGIGFANVGEVGSGPYQLSAVSFDASWNVVKTVTLTYGATQIPMLGFVHNP